MIKLATPVFLVGKKIPCWKCNARMTVVCILAEKYDVKEDEKSFGILFDITKLPPEILRFTQRKVPTFKRVFSKTTESHYFGNTCPQCGVLSGDFFLHCEVGAPFFPTEEREAKTLYQTTIPLNGPVTVEAGMGFGSGELILKHARKI